MYEKTIMRHGAEKEVAKVGQKRERGITQPQPFELATSKRLKLTEDDAPKKEDEYVPLWKQVSQSFNLRPD
jgi:hypothetical protein